MFKKAFAAIALAGTLTIVGASPSSATETYERRPTLLTYDQDVAARQAYEDAAATKAFAEIEQRLSSDPLLARQVQRAALAGDSAVAAELLSTDGAEVVAVGSTSGDSVQTEAVRVTVRVTVCVRVWGTVYCGTVTVTLDL